MSVEKTKFLARLIAFDEGSNETNEQDTIIDIVESGDNIELAFDDRDERVYLSFNPADFKRALRQHAVV